MEVDLRCSHCGSAPPAAGPQLLVCVCWSAAFCDKDCCQRLSEETLEVAQTDVPSRPVTTNVEAAQQAARPSAAVPATALRAGESSAQGDGDSGGGCGGSSAPSPAGQTDAAPLSPQVTITTTAIATGAGVELHGLQKAIELKSRMARSASSSDGMHDMAMASAVGGGPQARGFVRSGQLPVP